MKTLQKKKNTNCFLFYIKVVDVKMNEYKCISWLNEKIVM